MDATEKLALEHLSAMGFSNIEYEPDGKVPPDFLINGEIAVEVRRLNYNTRATSGRIEGTDSLRIAFVKMIRKTLASFGPPKDGRSWFVGYTFSRPIPHLPRLKKRIQKALDDFLGGRRDLEENELEIADRVVLHLIPTSSPRPACFILGGGTDRDTSGFLAPILQENIQVCLEEKTRKVAKVRARYSKWWLILVDHVGYGTKEDIQITHNWDKVLIINPMSPKQGYEL